MNPQMFNSFLDGTKSAIEMAAIANACGLDVPDGRARVPALRRRRPAAGAAAARRAACSRSAGMVEVVSSLERDGRPVFRDLRWGVYVVLEAPNDYAAACFRQYGLKTDAERPLRGDVQAVPPDRPRARHLGPVRGAARRADRAAARLPRRRRRRSPSATLRAGEMLDGEGGYTVWGKLMPAAASLARRRAADRARASRQAEERHSPRCGGPMERRRDRREQRHHQDAQGDGSRIRVRAIKAVKAAGGSPAHGRTICGTSPRYPSSR